MDKTYELFRNGGLLTTIKIKDHQHNVVELTIKQYMRDGDKEVVNNAYTTFYTPREIKEFFTPIIDDLKERFENENGIKQ